MVPEPKEYIGVVRNGKVEFEIGSDLRDAAKVKATISTMEQSAEGERDVAWNRLRAMMKKGYDLGEGPLGNREELYGDSGRPR